MSDTKMSPRSQSPDFIDHSKDCLCPMCQGPGSARASEEALTFYCAAKMPKVMGLGWCLRLCTRAPGHLSEYHQSAGLYRWIG